MINLKPFYIQNKPKSGGMRSYYYNITQFFKETDLTDMLLLKVKDIQKNKEENLTKESGKTYMMYSLQDVLIEKIYIEQRHDAIYKYHSDYFSLFFKVKGIKTPYRFDCDVLFDYFEGLDYSLRKKTKGDINIPQEKFRILEVYIISILNEGIDKIQGTFFETVKVFENQKDLNLSVKTRLNLNSLNKEEINLYKKMGEEISSEFFDGMDEREKGLWSELFSY